MKAEGELIIATIDGVAVQIRPRPDGGIRISSSEMPGLVLAGKDWWRTLSDVPKAIAVIRGDERYEARGWP